MPSVRRKIPWTRKPPLGTGVDWSNPLAQGLYYALPMAEGSALPQEIVQGATVTKTGSPTWTNDPGINFGAVTNYYALPAWNPTTITLLVMVYGGATGATQLTWWSRQFTTSLVPWMLSGNIATTGGMAAYNGVWNATNTAANPYVTTNYNDGLWHVIVGTSDGANLRYFIDGIQQGVKTFAANLPSNTSPVYLCQYLQNSAGFTGLMSLALAWGRALSPADVASISSNPWQIFQPAPGPLLWRDFNNFPCTVSASGLSISGGWGTTSPPSIGCASKSRIIPWTQKPPVGYGVNWGHPLAQSLVTFFACNEGGGAPVDLCYGLALTKNSTAPGTWSQDQNGAVYNTTVTGSGATIATPAYLQIQPPITHVWCGNLLGTPAASSYLAGVSYTNANTTPYSAFEYYFAVGPKVTSQYTYNTSAGNYQYMTSGILSNGPLWLATTIASTSQNLYVNNPWVASGSQGTTITQIAYASSLTFVGVPSFQNAYNANCSTSYYLIYNRILTSAELQLLYSSGPWGMIAPVKARRQQSFVNRLGFPVISASASGQAISGAQGGTTFPISSPASGMAISGAPAIATAGPSPGAAGLAISGAYGGTTFPISSSAAGLAISGAYGGTTAGPSPGAAGLAISGHLGGAAETISVLLAGLGISGAWGGATGAAYLGPFYLPYEYTSTVIETGNANPFGINPEQTTVITTGL